MCELVCMRTISRRSACLRIPRLFCCLFAWWYPPSRYAHVHCLLYVLVLWWRCCAAPTCVMVACCFACLMVSLLCGVTFAKAMQVHVLSSHTLAVGQAVANGVS